MRVAVIGGGGAGLVAAWLLEHSAEVTLFEAEDRLGGHMRTIRVDTEKGPVFAEMGFKHFFEATYPVFRAIHRVLGLAARQVKATATVVPRPGVALVGPPRGLGHVLHWLAHPGLALRFWEYWRFLWHAGRPGPDARGGPTLREAALAWGMKPSHVDGFFLPLVAANWGSPLADIADNPAWEIREVLWGASAPFLELEEGLAGYVKALRDGMPGVSVHTSMPVQALRREGDAWRLTTAAGETVADQVVLATGAPVAAALLASVPGFDAVRQAVGAVRTFETTIAVHRDPSWMPPRRSDWSGINVFFHPTHPWQTEWSGRRLDVDVFRSWVPPHRQPPPGAVAVHKFHHVVVRGDQLEAARQIAERNGEGGLWLAGMYTRGPDFHESAVGSGLAVAEALDPSARRLAALRAVVPPAAWPGPTGRGRAGGRS
jgi:uncharacterized protein